MIKKIKILSEELQVFFSNESHEIYPNIWLRDHAKDEKNWDKRSNQRITFTAALDFNIKIKKAEIFENGKYLKIFWPDLQKPVSYSYEFLLNNSLKNKLKSNGLKLWKEKELNHQNFINFKKVQSKQGFKEFLKLLHQFGFVVMTNCKTDISSVESIANKIGYVRNSIFGGLWSFESNDSMADSAYTQEELRPHTDGTYCHDAPGLQLLLCCDYDATGGESIMVDGFKIAEILKNTDKEIYNILTEIEIPGNYIGDGVHLEARRPVFKLTLDGKISQVSFNNYDRSDFRIPNNQIKAFYDSIRTFDKLANEKTMQWRKILEPGQMLIFNNWNKIISI